MFVQDDHSTVVTSLLSTCSQSHYDPDYSSNDWLELAHGVAMSVGFGSGVSTGSFPRAGSVSVQEAVRQDVLTAIREAVETMEYSQLRIWRETVS